MCTKIKNIIQCMIFAVFLLVMFLLCIFSEDKDISEAENRKLTQFPELNIASVKNGEFMEGFESYALDQFPGRQIFRQIKAVNSEYILNLGDNNGFYKKDGVIAEITYPLNKESVSYACKRFNYLYDNFIESKGMNVYMAVIPDKNELLSIMSIDKEELFAQLKDEFPEAELIDIYPLLTAEDYYATDHHWKQESLINVAQYIVEQMGTEIPGEGEYSVETLNDEFYGVYYEQALLPTEPDEIKVLRNDIIDSFEIINWDTGLGEEIDAYDEEKAKGDNPYDAYLSGAMVGVITIENPNADNDKELYIFRDSFGSSISPLIAQGYKKVTIIDLRVHNSIMAGMKLRNPDADVLFLYSSLVLNDSNDLK